MQWKSSDAVKKDNFSIFVNFVLKTKLTLLVPAADFCWYYRPDVVYCYLHTITIEHPELYESR